MSSTPQFRLTIEDGQFRDRKGRTVVLRGINLAGDAKLPSEPDQPSHVGTDFFDGDSVKFHARPFPKDEAHIHFSRLKRWGFNTIRYVFTWEALEAAGPGRYDEEFIQHTIDILRLAKGYGFYVFMDPHQDVRDEKWKMGECLWAQLGVWDPKTDTLLKKDYFKKNPRTGLEYTFPNWTQTHFMDGYRRYRDAIRAIHTDCIMIMQYPTLELPPKIKGTEDDDPNMAFAPHWYDGITLMTKKWNKLWNVDVVGVLRGRYWTPALAVKVGETAIRNCFRDQHNYLYKEGKEHLGNHPCIMTEFGIPYDMDDHYAYKTGDYTSQSAAMDANYFGVEGSGMEGHCLWLYTVSNTHEYGDQWNGEDLSIFSHDDKLLPTSPLPPHLDPNENSVKDLMTGDGARNLPNDFVVTPGNLESSMRSPSISSAPSGKDPEISNAPGFPGGRGYKLRIRSDFPPSDDAPTIVFVPEHHFPKDNCQVTVSSGKWELSEDADAEEPSAPQLQRLKWWHGDGEQTLRLNGLVRRHNLPNEGTDEEQGYLDQCRQQYGTCSLIASSVRAVLTARWDGSVWWKAWRVECMDAARRLRRIQGAEAEGCTCASPASLRPVDRRPLGLATDHEIRPPLPQQHRLGLVEPRHLWLRRAARREPAAAEWQPQRDDLHKPAGWPQRRGQPSLAAGSGSEPPSAKDPKSKFSFLSRKKKQQQRTTARSRAPTTTLSRPRRPTTFSRQIRLVPRAATPGTGGPTSACPPPRASALPDTTTNDTQPRPRGKKSLSSPP
ncbi:Protein tyrosine kinase [Verticillium alfalfae VaMs.102]|uniref:Protein tyrosine kinase n=1 Tax=Verticillium alfalfae (strain VaMs.102 / ATCC MYA-4576 / FGSC 10136) TaxID=526221 RepID=C9SGP0_VERA1|nr:Protein tyrosine kinase [Verticillium alfalfae VaMs.102]EEY17535.1 Protein tyrosine kinase [Verticillium alfalfae VaMs.102]